MEITRNIVDVYIFTILPYNVVSIAIYYSVIFPSFYSKLITINPYIILAMCITICIESWNSKSYGMIAFCIKWANSVYVPLSIENRDTPAYCIESILVDVAVICIIIYCYYHLCEFLAIDCILYYICNVPDELIEDISANWNWILVNFTCIGIITKSLFLMLVFNLYVKRGM